MEPTKETPYTGTTFRASDAATPAAPVYTTAAAEAPAYTSMTGTTSSAAPTQTPDAASAVPPPPVHPSVAATMATPTEAANPKLASDSASGAPYTPPPPPLRTARSSSHQVSKMFEGEPDGGLYIRNPHILVAYLIPFPQPRLLEKHLLKKDQNIGGDIPLRFLIYTPPPPPLEKPKEGEKEGKVHKLQRKWEEEVREAKTTNAKVTSWKGIKSRATKGIHWGLGKVTSADLDFLNRIPTGSSAKGSGSSKPSSTAHTPNDSSDDEAHDNDPNEDQTTQKTVGLEEMVLIYPPRLQQGDGKDDERLRAQFIENVMRTKSKAQKEAVIASGLLPVAFAVDIALTLVWPFGGLAEIDGVWAASSIRGAKTARSISKRLASSTDDGNLEADSNAAAASKGPNLKLTFRASARDELLERYLASKCTEADRELFPRSGSEPTASEVLDAIGWHPSAGERNWEDDAYEREQVKEDLEKTMRKAAKQWTKWVKAYAKNPEKALKN